MDIIFTIRCFKMGFIFVLCDSKGFIIFLMKDYFIVGYLVLLDQTLVLIV